MSPIISRCSTMSLFFLCMINFMGGRIIEPVLEISKQETNITGDTVIETQHAICKIVTQEVAANAHASMTRVLNGVCNARTINDKFENLERNLTRELKELKTFLYYVILEQGVDIMKLKNSFENSSLIVEQKSLHQIIPEEYNALLPRTHEINKYNDTIQQLNDTTSVFTYYWQVENLAEQLSMWETGRFQRSPTLQIKEKRYAMYLMVTPKYFPDGTVFVGVGLTRGRYDAILEWPFPLQMRIEILDLSVKSPREDRHSRIWDPSSICSEQFWGRPKLSGDPDNPVCVGLSVPKHVILSKMPSFGYNDNRYTKYLWNSTMVVKLTVFL